MKNILAAFLLCVTVCPADEPAHHKLESVVRVYVHADNDCCIDFYGSGFLVSPTQVLTNWHVVKDRRVPVRGRKGAVQLRFHNGCRTYASVIGYNSTWDLAVLKINAVNYPPLTLGERPFEGQTAFVHGFGSDYEYRVLRGIVAKTNVSPRGSDEPDLMGVNGAPSRSGDSGGPITDLKGLVIGILNSTDDVSTGGIMIDRVQKVFKNILKPSRVHDYSLGEPKDADIRN